MKKCLLPIFVLLVFLLSITISFAESDVSIEIDGKKVTFSAETGYPFINEDGRTQVPFKTTVKSFGAQVLWDSEAQMNYATYNDTKVYVPIGESYIIVNGEQIPNDTTTFIKDEEIYCSISRIFKVFGFGVSWDANSNTVLVNTDGSQPKITTPKVEVPYPNLTSKYTATDATGKYTGYKILHGFPEEDEFTLYFKGSRRGSINSLEYTAKEKSPKNMNDRFTWTFEGVTATGTRQELYSLISNVSGSFSEEWMVETFGEVFLDWFDYQLFTYNAEQYINAYFDGYLQPDSINFTVVDSDWMTPEELKSNYGLYLDTYNKHFSWTSDGLDATVIHPIPDYYDFPNGFIAFSNIRMIKDLNGLQVYVPDVEKYVMAPIKEKADELLSEQLAWINEDDLLDEYGVYLKKDNTGMIVSNSVGIGFVSDEDQFSYESYNDEDPFFYPVPDFNPSFIGEKTFSGIRMKETRGNLYINTEDFKEKVVPKLNKYNTKKEQAEEELRAIEKEWLSQYNLQDYNLKLVEAYDRGKKTGSFFEYSLEGNGKSVKLKGLIDYSTNKNTEKTFGGIRVKFYEDHMYFNLEDLEDKGFID